MEMLLKNYMEDIVRDNLDSVMKGTGCCLCDICKLDVTAIALNNLKPAYVVTQQGEVYTRTRDIAIQFHADVVAAITTGAELVKHRPRHQ